MGFRRSYDQSATAAKQMSYTACRLRSVPPKVGKWPHSSYFPRWGSRGGYIYKRQTAGTAPRTTPTHSKSRDHVVRANNPSFPPRTRTHSMPNRKHPARDAHTIRSPTQRRLNAADARKAGIRNPQHQLSHRPRARERAIERRCARAPGRYNKIPRGAVGRVSGFDAIW
jgi:hypothetical protein